MENTTPREIATRGMKRKLSMEAVRILLLEDKCPECLGELDTGWECNECNFDAFPLVKKLSLESLRRTEYSKRESA